MRKYLFFDYQQIEVADGFTRRLEKPRKHSANPLLIADQPWENGNMQLYGSVIKAPGRPFQLWYSVIHKPWRMYLAYAESDDGIAWRKPLFDLIPWEGQKTNLLLDRHIHGPAVIYDEDDPDPNTRYKMLAGASPSDGICLFVSADGIKWQQVSRYPVMTTNPDSPIGFVRCRGGGRYYAYHRNYNPFSGRRICRSESWNLRQWTLGDPGIVLEPDAGDPPQIQFYGMGSALYGPYEIGTLWVYHTDPDDRTQFKMVGYQEAELAYARPGNCWHRAAQGVTFIAHGQKGAWDEGNLQCASQPVFLDNEIRYYYAGTNARHKIYWELEPQRAGLGLATLQPDRFIALDAGADGATLMTQNLVLAEDNIFVNAAISAQGSASLALLDATTRQPLPGFDWSDCVPLRGDATAHAVTWRGATLPTGAKVHLALRAHAASIYSIYLTKKEEQPVYHRF